MKVDLLFSGDIIALRALAAFPEYSPPLPFKFRNPQEVRAVFCEGWLGTFGPSKCIQMDEGGEWGNEIWTDVRKASR